MRIKLAFCIIALGLLVAAYVAVSAGIKGQMEEALSAACQRPVSIESARLILPAGIQLTGLVVPRMGRETESPFSVDEVHVQFALDKVMQGQPVGDLELIGPTLSMEWNSQIRQYFSWGILQSLPVPAVAIRNLKIREGRLKFVDAVAVPSVPWITQDLSFEMEEKSDGRERSFRVAASLLDLSGKKIGSFKADGSVIQGGPVDVTVSLSYQEVARLSPYLRQVLGPTPTQGAVELESRIIVHGGILLAQNQLTASGIRFSTDEPTTLGTEGNRLVELLSDSEGNIQLGFIIKGDLEKKFNWSSLAAGAIREAMRQALARSIQRVLIEVEQVKPLEEELRKSLDSLGR